MDQGMIHMLFLLLRSAIRGILLSEEERAQYSEDILPELITLSRKHDILHLLALGLKKNSLLAQDQPVLARSIYNAVYRQELLAGEFSRLCEALETAEIPFLPLKGSVIRQYYPEQWMRTSCDIDILIHEENLDNAIAFLCENYGYTFNKKGAHDASMFSSNRVHLELHYTLMEDDVAQSASRILCDVWNATNVKDATSYWHEMTDEMFYFYHVSHMAKHLEQGGCGIRPFIDLWILDHQEKKNTQKRDELLKKGNLLRFAQVAAKLSHVWFADAEMDEISQQMQDYILCGGVYGSNKNRIMLQQQQKGGRFNYALSKIYIPYDVIKFQYPIVQKHRWLVPFMQVRRWCKLIFCGHIKRSIRELQYNQNITEDQAEKAKDFLCKIGLQ